MSTQNPIIVHAPASKSVSHRMVMGASLANGESVVENVLESQDLFQTMEILSNAGARFEKIDKGTYKINGALPRGGEDMQHATDCNVHESGTTCRLLTAILASGQGFFHIHGAKRMHERPIGTLTAALEELGAKFLFEKEGYPPFLLKAKGLNGGEITVSLEESSQYLSGLLLAAPLCKEPLTIYIGGTHVVSWPYIGLTLDTMKKFGARFDISVKNKENSTDETIKWKPVDYRKITEIIPHEIRFRVRPFAGSGTYKSGKYTVEGDWSGASYLLAAGVLGQKPVTVVGLNKDSLQADKALLDILTKMGAETKYGDNGEITVFPSELKGIAVDMADCPDIVPTIAAVAAFAEGETKIENIAHLRIKECDRLHAMALELQKIGIETVEYTDYLIVKGNPNLKNIAEEIQFASYGDHRIVMSLSLLNLKGIKTEFDNPMAITKSFPEFFDVWKTICISQ